jgi:hypothetical protein
MTMTRINSRGRNNLASTCAFRLNSTNSTASIRNEAHKTQCNDYTQGWHGLSTPIAEMDREEESGGSMVPQERIDMISVILDDDDGG